MCARTMVHTQCPLGAGVRAGAVVLGRWLHAALRLHLYWCALHSAGCRGRSGPWRPLAI